MVCFPSHSPTVSPHPPFLLHVFSVHHAPLALFLSCILLWTPFYSGIDIPVSDSFPFVLLFLEITKGAHLDRRVMSGADLLDSRFHRGSLDEREALPSSKIRPLKETANPSCGLGFEAAPSSDARDALLLAVDLAGDRSDGSFSWGPELNRYAMRFDAMILPPSLSDKDDHDHYFSERDLYMGVMTASGPGQQLFLGFKKDGSTSPSRMGEAIKAIYNVRSQRLEDVTAIPRAEEGGACQETEGCAFIDSWGLYIGISSEGDVLIRASASGFEPSEHVARFQLPVSEASSTNLSRRWSFALLSHGLAPVTIQGLMIQVESSKFVMFPYLEFSNFVD